MRHTIESFVLGSVPNHESSHSLRTHRKGKYMNTIRTKHWRKLIGLFALVTIIVAVTASGNRSAAAIGSSEQVVFSGVGFADAGDCSTPVGFWIWCEADSENPYAGRCSGAMYLYFRGITKGVKGTISEGPDHIYTMTVHSNDGVISDASLHNVSPTITRGPTNWVDFSVTAPCGGSPTTVSGSTGPTAVVRVTGP